MEKVVRRLMRKGGLDAVTTKRLACSAYHGEINLAPENLINRHFRATAQNEKWLTDIAEFQTPAEKVYLLPTIDRIVGPGVSCTSGT
ncbi:hypothetical protein [Burkholderia metallica]|uniref:hypothetical protein n=1 Tax=Burkholderia metallica TaxID=488729 RepID=UPI001CF45643|nr:hypothetical protein [Burkholderia metallica]MCA8003295.1 hypothetical protein [Burkholderia metallica]